MMIDMERITMTSINSIIRKILKIIYKCLNDNLTSSKYDEDRYNMRI